jgi:hypothetical protein
MDNNFNLDMFNLDELEEILFYAKAIFDSGLDRGLVSAVKEKIRELEEIRGGL